MEFPLNHTRELRRKLGQALEQVMSGEIAADQARAVVDLSGAILNAARYDMEVLQMVIQNAGPLKIEFSPGEAVIESIVGETQADSISGDSQVRSLTYRIADLLSKNGETKPRMIASQLGVDQKTLEAALLDEQFEKTPLGYRMAK